MNNYEYTKNFDGLEVGMDKTEYDYWQALDAENAAFIAKFGDEWSLEKNIDIGHYRWVFNGNDDECRAANVAMDARNEAFARLAKLSRGHSTSEDEIMSIFE